MNGPVEESAKVANTLVEAMKSQPMALALITVNMVFLITVGWGTYKARESFMGTIEKLIDKQEKIDQMLYNCVPTKSNAEDHGAHDGSESNRN